MKRRPPSPPPLFGAMLRFERINRGWSETDLAVAAGFSSPSLVSEYERGSKRLSRERLEELLALLGVPPEAIDDHLFARQIASPPASPGSPVDPSPAEQRCIHRAATQAGLGAFKATQERLMENVRRRKAARDRRQAEELGKTLMELSPKLWRAAVEDDRRYWTWGFAEWLCERSARAAAHRAKTAMTLARLALRVAERVSGSTDWRSLLLGFVWAFVANSRRVQGDLPGAEQAFHRSDRLWAAGASANSGLLDGSRRLDLRAALFRQQGHYEEALFLLGQAFSACRSAEAQARILVMKATTLTKRGDYEEAIAALTRAEPMSKGARDPRLTWLIQFSMASALWHLARYREAEALLPEVRKLAVSLGNELDLIRVLWLTGRVAAGMGRRDQAVSALEQVQRYFTVNRIALDAAKASLELAVFYIEEGQTKQTKLLAEEMYWIFNAQKVAEEVLAALRLFCEAARKEEVTPELASRLVEFLQEACTQPRLRFEDFIRNVEQRRGAR